MLAARDLLRVSIVRGLRVRLAAPVLASLLQVLLQLPNPRTRGAELARALRELCIALLELALRIGSAGSLQADLSGRSLRRQPRRRQRLSAHGFFAGKRGVYRSIVYIVIELFITELSHAELNMQ